MDEAEKIVIGVLEETGCGSATMIQIADKAYMTTESVEAIVSGLVEKGVVKTIEAYPMFGKVVVLQDDTGQFPLSFMFGLAAIVGLIIMLFRMI